MSSLSSRRAKVFLICFSSGIFRSSNSDQIDSQSRSIHKTVHATDIRKASHGVKASAPLGRGLRSKRWLNTNNSEGGKSGRS